ncbi:WD40 repeat domain-containing [Paramuricea clavata]|nr:WD40 repeat domain-containing [Paramuricea clavata]
MTYTCSEDATVCQIDLGSLKVSTVCQGRIPVVITPDGKAILFRKVSDNSLIYYEFSTDSVVAYIEGHPDASIITAIDITTDGKLVLSGSSSGTISLVDLKSSNVVQTFGVTEAGVGIRLVSVLSDVAHFVFVDEGNRVVLRTFNNKEAELVLDQPAVKVTCITTHSGKYVFLGCENGELLLFDIYATQYKYNHQAHSEAVSQVKSNPTGFLHLLVSGSASGRVTLWCVSKTVPPLWSQIWSHDNVYPHLIADVAFVPHSEDIVIGSCYDSKVS